MKITHRFASEQPDMFNAMLREIIVLSSPIVPENNRTRRLSSVIASCITRVECLHLKECIVTDTVMQNCLRSCTCLTVLELRGVPFCKAIVEFVELQVTDCVHFTRLQGLADLNNLIHLSIGNCPNLDCLSVGDITLVPQLLSRKACSSLPWLRILGSTELRGEEILQQLTSLKFLTFHTCEWNSLPQNMASLACLQQLTLQTCENIRSLPMLHESLQTFELRFCDPSFMKSCQEGGHPNWQKIAHVPRKHYNY
uniref:Uncharacterized protein n=1 Tax=Oryza punctata TaxID=4537 RepID=A0A0E0KM58_ORYPU